MSTPWDDAPAYMDFEEPMGYDERVAKGLESEGKPRAGKKRSRKAPGDDDKRLTAIIPVLPPKKELTTGDEKKRGISNRDRSAANLKLDGATYLEIAEALDFLSPAHAKAAVERTLAAIHPLTDLETLRTEAVLRAERLFARSSAMASADYLVDKETGEKVPNPEKRAWHQQAGMDLMNLVNISGAKAATRIEITPDEERMEQLVAQVVSQLGHEEVLDAEVLELEQIPEAPDEDEV